MLGDLPENRRHDPEQEAPKREGTVSSKESVQLSDEQVTISVHEFDQVPEETMHPAPPPSIPQAEWVIEGGAFTILPAQQSVISRPLPRFDHRDCLRYNCY